MFKMKKQIERLNSGLSYKRNVFGNFNLHILKRFTNFLRGQSLYSKNEWDLKDTDAVLTETVSVLRKPDRLPEPYLISNLVPFFW